MFCHNGIPELAESAGVGANGIHERTPEGIDCRGATVRRQARRTPRRRQR
jgi:hypothetical protein